MKESKFVKVILIMIISFSVILLAKDALATDFIDFTNTVNGNNTTTTEDKNNTVANNTTSNKTTNNTVANNSVLTTNNTSNYNNSTLPKTGVAGSVSSVILVVVLGISAVYAYKKMQYYRNI